MSDKPHIPDTEFLNRIALIKVQTAYLSDGRKYNLQVHDGGKTWEHLTEVNSTQLCDYATRWWLMHRTSRIRAMPAK